MSGGASRGWRGTAPSPGSGALRTRAAPRGGDPRTPAHPRGGPATVRDLPGDRSGRDHAPHPFAQPFDQIARWRTPAVGQQILEFERVGLQVVELAGAVAVLDVEVSLRPDPRVRRDS